MRSSPLIMPTVILVRFTKHCTEKKRKSESSEKREESPSLFLCKSEKRCQFKLADTKWTSSTSQMISLQKWRAAYLSQQTYVHCELFADAFVSWWTQMACKSCFLVSLTWDKNENWKLPINPLSPYPSLCIPLARWNSLNSLQELWIYSKSESSDVRYCHHFALWPSK